MKYACDICEKPVSIDKGIRKGHSFEEVYYSLDGSPNYSIHAICFNCFLTENEDEIS